MPTEIYKDILSIEEGIICQQINPHVMGAGLALAIRRLHPKVYEEFMYRRATDPIGLGEVLFVDVNDKLTVANMCAQHEYGRDHTKVYTSYIAFQECLKSIDYHAIRNTMKVYFPYKIGCGLANGNWDSIIHLIEQSTPYAYICRLGRKPK